VSGTTKALKWGTVLTWLLGTKSVPIIITVLVAFATLVGIIVAFAPHAYDVVQSGINATDSYFQSHPIH
jgi:hypothetical protein